MGFLDTIEADGDGLIIPIPPEERSFASIAPQSLESLHKSSLSLPHTSIGYSTPSGGMGRTMRLPIDYITSVYPAIQWHERRD
jgi:hypothetical protein